MYMLYMYSTVKAVIVKAPFFLYCRPEDLVIADTVSLTKGFCCCPLAFVVNI